MQQEALEVAARMGEDAAEWGAVGRPPLTDTLAQWVAARYAVATRHVADTEGIEGWRRLRELCSDLVELRRGDHSAERLRMEREQLELEREQARVRTEDEFLEWAMQDQNRELICKGFATRKQGMEQLMKRMFGVHPGHAGTGTKADLPGGRQSAPPPCQCNKVPDAPCDPPTDERMNPERGNDP